ncbi:hypothetical protein ACLB2K_046626 [Fragaria x ananassa]
MATVTTPQPPPSPRTDAIALHKAFKGFGCDTSSIISILAHRDSTQRAQIAREYRTMYSEDLSKCLSSELSGNTKQSLLLWTPDPATRDATIVRHALTSSDLRAATEVICSRTPSQISQFKQLYHTMFNTQLERDVGMFTSGDLKNLLLGFVTTPRYEGLEFDRLAAENDAKSLYRAGEKRLGTDERKFIEIFTGRSRCHLNAVSSAYESMYGNSLRKVL